MAKLLALSVLLLAWSAAAAPVGQVSNARLSFVVHDSLLRVPYYRNMALTGSYPQVDRAAIMVSGTERNASQAYANLVAAEAIAGLADSTVLLVAPQFLTEEDVSAHGLPDDMLFWSEQGWKEGSYSLSTASHPRPDSISSFAVMDSILYRIASHNPNLRTIVVAGHSAGGQFVNRYAAGNTIEPVLRFQFGVDLSYVVSNASSYMYFDATRAVPGTSPVFDVPPPESLATCPGYDTYKYGLLEPNAYMSSVSPGQLMAQYSSRVVTYLLGELDTDPAHPDLDTTCPAEWQGPHRLARGFTYLNHLREVFGHVVLTRQRVIVVRGVGHNSTDMFTSVCGVDLLFGGGVCDTPVGVGPAHSPPLGLSLRCPNPIRIPVLIQFRVPDGGKRVMLSVYDIRGRAVRTLVDAARPAGPGAVLWDGRSETGARVAPGMYFCRLQQGRAAVATKLAILQ